MLQHITNINKLSLRLFLFRNAREHSSKESLCLKLFFDVVLPNKRKWQQTNNFTYAIWGASFSTAGKLIFNKADNGS
jgi:hypothetical protein